MLMPMGTVSSAPIPACSVSGGLSNVEGGGYVPPNQTRNRHAGGGMLICRPDYKTIHPPASPDLYVSYFVGCSTRVLLELVEKEDVPPLLLSAWITDVQKS